MLVTNITCNSKIIEIRRLGKIISRVAVSEIAVIYKNGSHFENLMIIFLIKGLKGGPYQF